MCFRANGGSTIIEVVKEAKRLKGGWVLDINPDNLLFDYTIVQIGICDVTPRLFPKRVYSRLKWLPFFKLIHRKRIFYKIFGRPWISQKRFRYEVDSLIKVLKSFSKDIVFIGIAPPVKNLLYNVGDFTDLVNIYNQVLKENNSIFLDCWGKEYCVKDFFLNDGHHLSIHGHRHLFELLKKKISI